ncbi:XisH family protein [Coleofasciculus sp. FACHB-712]|uniref:XisH family protein n=1 Tax=Cyanophyceae TaxID=3028117 RepID=UPI0016839424|nr:MULTISPECIES: XisH family protein [unclassified Coleofasciculus]MBD1942397.1 XisH family protein [Coleofasciculus sp. FACHB-712]MBD2542149.1 XisH family protein [Coleofasciculus sp. FACHB-SPT36]
MAAKDLFHNAVKQALLKEQWTITADPLTIKIEGVKFEIDLAAEKVFAADKAGRKIAVEVKSFLNNSVINDFHVALGQFLNYRLALQMREPDRTLYLAIPFDTFDSFFQERFVQEAVKIYQLKLVVYDPSKEVVIEWKD